MNREIKLRIRLKNKKDGKEIVLFNSVFDAKTGIAFYEIDRNEWGLILFEQYTGLKDKNGKEIYEGDIVNHDSSIYPCKIIFKRKIAQFMAKEILKDGNGGKVWQISEKKIIEVLGNIYKNPELL